MNNSNGLKTAEHLMHLIVTRNGHVPNFALLLGSGASKTSKVSTAEDMVNGWRRLLHRRAADNNDYGNWLENQDWHGDDDEYSILFEHVFDQPSQRRVYIEECIKNAHPSWGYVYLTNLLFRRFFDVVFTTNFDDLINEACYLYSEKLRPVVAAHDSAIQGIRVTSGRPKIIKLHGDFLYDNIKNTLAELETLETNTKRKFSQFAQEYGLVVLGYSGRDRSVMDTLDLLLRDEENFKQGVYWCQRPDSVNSSRLTDLLRRDRVYQVEIEGFDEFMAELHRSADLLLPKPIAEPLAMARDRSKLFIDVDRTLKDHSIIGRDVENLVVAIGTQRPTVPPVVEAYRLSEEGRTDESLPFWIQALQEDPDDESIAERYAEALAILGKNEELSELIKTSSLDAFNRIYYSLRAGRNDDVIALADEYLSERKGGDEDFDYSRAAVRINRAIAYKRLGRMEEMNDELQYLEKTGASGDINIKAGIAALKKDKEEMMLSLRKAIGQTLTQRDLKVFPVFEDYRDDRDFVKLIEHGA